MTHPTTDVAIDQLGPCPSWCESKYCPEEWSEYPDSALRSHETQPLGSCEDLFVTSHGPAEVEMLVYIGAYEVAGMLSNGRGGPSVLEVAEIRLSVAKKLDDKLDGEISLDLDVERARELAAWLSAAADRDPERRTLGNQPQPPCREPVEVAQRLAVPMHRLDRYGVRAFPGSAAA
jgi:hypothetical protein